MLGSRRYDFDMGCFESVRLIVYSIGEHWKSCEGDGGWGYNGVKRRR